MKKFLNVGGNSKAIPVPPAYEGWEHHLLDIDPDGEPDICCDARELMDMDINDYDAVYNSHNLEHYYHHDVPKVLKGFHHVLKDNGFVDIRVPDIQQVMRYVVQSNIDLEDTLYQSGVGPITVLDVIYGYGKEIRESGNPFYAHKTGFTPKTLQRALIQAGFPVVYMSAGNFELQALALKQPPNEEQKALFKLP